LRRALLPSHSCDRISLFVQVSSATTTTGTPENTVSMRHIFAVSAIIVDNICMVLTSLNFLQPKALVSAFTSDLEKALELPVSSGLAVEVTRVETALSDAKKEGSFTEITFHVKKAEKSEALPSRSVIIV
jgi:hypothetical protein